jgi:hypothetical protein
LLALPDISGGDHLLYWLREFGPFSTGPAGVEPVSFMEIQAWANLTQTKMLPEEALILRRLSMLYCSQYRKSEKPDCPAPYIDTQIDRAAVSKRLLSAFRSHSRYKKVD